MRINIAQERVKTVIVILLSSWLLSIPTIYAGNGFIDIKETESSPYTPNKRIHFNLSVNDFCFKKIASINLGEDSYALNKNLRYKKTQKLDLSIISKSFKDMGLKIVRQENLKIVKDISETPLEISGYELHKDYYRSDNINTDIDIIKYYLESIQKIKPVIIILDNKQKNNKKILEAFQETTFYYKNRFKNTFYNENITHTMSIPASCSQEFNIQPEDFYDPSGQFNLSVKDSLDDSMILIAHFSKDIQNISQLKTKNKSNKKSLSSISKKNKINQVDKENVEPTVQNIKFIFSERPFLQTNLRAKFLEEGTKIIHISSGKELIVTPNKDLQIQLPLEDKISDQISINNPNYSIVDHKRETNDNNTIINTIVRDTNDKILIVYYPLDPTTSYRSRIPDDTAKLMNFEFSSFLAQLKEHYSKVYYRMREEGPLKKFKEKALLGQELLMSNDELRNNEEFNWSDTSIYDEIKQMNESSQIFHIIYFTGKNEPDLIRIFQKAPNAYVYAIQFERNTQSIEDKDVNEYLHLHKISYNNLSSSQFNDIFNSSAIIEYFRKQK